MAELCSILAIHRVTNSSPVRPNRLRKGDLTRAPDVMVAILLEYLFVFPKSLAAQILPYHRQRELCQRWFPSSPPLLWRLAQAEFAQGNFAMCAQTLEHFLAIRAGGTFDRSMSFSPQIMGDRPLLNLGVCYVRLAQLDQAETCFRKLLHSNECASEASQNLAVVHKLRATFNS